jgi:hypothetical protein
MGVERFGVAKWDSIFATPNLAICLGSYRDFAALRLCNSQARDHLPTAHCPLLTAHCSSHCPLLTDSPASVLAVLFNLFRAPLTDLSFGFERNDPAAIPCNFEPVGAMISAAISAGGQTVRRD